MIGSLKPAPPRCSSPSRETMEWLGQLKQLEYQRGGIMLQTVRTFLFLEALTFAVSARAHLVVDGFRHLEASIAESVIAFVLLIGLMLTWVDPWVRRAAIGAQAFALLGTLVGLLTIAIGIGPRTLVDIVYHIGIVGVLIAGLALTQRAPSLARNP